MTLKKSISPNRNEDGSWPPQIDIDMHPVEEAEILARWAIHDVKMKIPPKPLIEDEHEMLINEGADAVKKARVAWQAAYDAIQPELTAAEQKHQDCVKAWHTHIEKCLPNKLNPDTTPEGKYDAIG